ncbi:hypothetical protein BHU61_12520 [Macrococcus epidermidis]|uniref:Uncharacterized protein n=1 Tax=Macrococcus epidermidis TaxID=1902580 RepID=A0A327ZMS3_9STAP|nr:MULTISPECIES: hypothetical protein [Macrococcus]MCG7418849.1 hypothetical protein [Macrococcus epidermidis]MCH4984348.1 hypothetical protein [Macrococcus sp. PK]MCH4985735.1 hypothetical protein [Macrococcus sp. PK]RAK43717.1 hypothetical protein BHU61_12520 [Macrococcus epidermidis]
MNKWVKRGLVVGALTVGAVQGVKYLEKNEMVKKRLNDLKNVKEYNDLRKAIMEVVHAFNNNNAPRLEQQFQNNDFVTDQTEPTNNVQEETIGEAVKRVLDTPVVTNLIGDKADIDMMKDLIDETAEVEKLIRSWFN